METTLIVSLCVAFVIVLLFLIHLFRFRFRVLKYDEEIEFLKSKIQITKARANESMKKVSSKAQISKDLVGSVCRSYPNNKTYVTVGNGSKGLELNANALDSSATRYGDSFSNELNADRIRLNETIKEYNIYISEFRNIIVKAIFKRQKISYIDNLNLDESMKLDDTKW